MSDTLTFYDAAGNSVNLNDGTNIKVLFGDMGNLMPPIKHAEEQVPLEAGSRFIQANVQPRRVDVPVAIKGTSRTDFLSNLRDLFGVLGNFSEGGYLRWGGSDGITRDLKCLYAGGVEGRFRDRQSSYVWTKAIISFRAFDPYWYAISETTESYTTGEVATFFPFFPLSLASSEVFATPTITVLGDVESWPVWTIIGPGSNPLFRNFTTDKLLSLTYSLGAGEQIIIDTRPGQKTIKLGDDTNLFEYLSNTSSLWPLIKGANLLRLELTGADENTRIDLSYYNRYWSR